MTGPTVAIPQLSLGDLAPEENKEKIRTRAEQLPDHVDIACFPEYALTGFVADSRAFSGALTRDDAIDFLSGLTAEHEFDVLDEQRAFVGSVE